MQFPGISIWVWCVQGDSTEKVSFIRDHFSLNARFAPFFFFLNFWSPDFYELWHSVMSTWLITEVKQQWATLVVGRVTDSVHYSCLWLLAAYTSRSKPLSALLIVWYSHYVLSQAILNGPGCVWIYIGRLILQCVLARYKASVPWHKAKVIKLKSNYIQIQAHRKLRPMYNMYVYRDLYSCQYWVNPDKCFFQSIFF